MLKRILLEKLINLYYFFHQLEYKRHVDFYHSKCNSKNYIFCLCLSSSNSWCCVVWRVLAQTYIVKLQFLIFLCFQSFLRTCTPFYFNAVVTLFIYLQCIDILLPIQCKYTLYCRIALELDHSIMRLFAIWIYQNWYVCIQCFSTMF